MNRKAKISKDVKHQGIGGKIIEIEKEMSLDYLLDRNLNEMTIAEYNFVKRRMDLFTNNDECNNIKIYYGHVGDFGYFVCEDEIEMI